MLTKILFDIGYVKKQYLLKLAFNKCNVDLLM